MKLLEAGVRDMVRISDSRMSGTSYGTCVLHVSPESHVGGPLAFVETGDFIEPDVEGRRIHLDVSDEILEKRRNRSWIAATASSSRRKSPRRMKGAIFRFLHGKTEHAEPDIF